MNYQPVNFQKRSEEQINTDADYVFSILGTYTHTFGRLGLTPDRLAILEIGPGTDFGAQLILASMGANVTLADRFLTQFDPDYHPRLYAEVAKRWGGPKGQLEAAIRGGHDATSLRLIPEPAEDMHTIADSSVDIVYSNAVLEHVADMSAVARELARVTSPGGYGRHQIDWRYHREFSRPLEHLAMSEQEFQQIAPKIAYDFGNRLRSIEFWAHFEAEGFFVVDRNTTDHAATPYLFDALPRLRASTSIYKHWPESDLRRTGGCLTIRRESGKDEAAARARGEDLLSVIAALKSV